MEGDLVTLSLLVHTDINDEEVWLVDWVLEQEGEEEAGSSRLLAKVKLLIGWRLTEEEAESPVLAEAESPVLAEAESPVLAEEGSPVLAEAESPVLAEAGSTSLAEVEFPVLLGTPHQCCWNDYCELVVHELV